MTYDSFADLERGQWSDPSVAASYASGFSQATAGCVPHLLRASGAARGMAALDICCGHGIVAEGLAAAGCAVTMLDFSPAMLELARARVPSARAVEGDACALPFEADAFDAATMGYGILHVPDQGAALREAARVLRPGARLALSSWMPPAENPAFRAALSSIEAHGAPGLSLPPGPDMFAYTDEATAFPPMEAAGFEDLRLEVVETAFETEAPDTLFRFFEEGTARFSAMLVAQPPDRRDAIRGAMAATLRDELGAPPWRIPSPTALVSGRAAGA